MVQANKKIALLHRYPAAQIKETNAAFPYLANNTFQVSEEKQDSIGIKGTAIFAIDVLTFKKFNRLSKWRKHIKSFLWIFYAPLLVIGKGYDVIYCDDSYPFYPALVKLVSPRSKVIIRLGDLHLMYYFSGFVFKILHFFEKIAWKMSDEIICISYAMVEYVFAETDKLPKLALDPIDPKDFQTDFNITLRKVMFHGVLTKNKNVDILLEAARRLPYIGFDIIGAGPDLKRLKKLAPENVTFHGWVPFKDIKYFISVCSVGVALRSSNPGNEYVVTSPFLQYGIMGKPCLVTRRRVFGDYEWQFSGVEEMVEKIKILLDKPEEGTKLRTYILQNHDAKKIAEDIWEILKSV